MAMASGKKTLLGIIAVFVAPIVLGSVVFLNSDRLGLSVETTNYGTLVQPPVNLSVEGVTVNEAPADVEVLIRNKWTLLYITPAECGDACKARQALMKRMRLLTNEDMRRLQTASVYPQAPSNTAELAENHSNMAIAVANEGASDFLKQFPKRDEHPIYVIDPLGNLMMYYTGDSPDIKRIMKDFKRILKYSQIG
jgi:cytochrome oxidase Cu insertion factor (SCO1/SenC/PrrC family)